MDKAQTDMVVVTWRQFVITIIPMITVPVVVAWALINAYAATAAADRAVHAALPVHAGAVHVREFERAVTELRDVKAELQHVRQSLAALEGMQREMHGIRDMVQQLRDDITIQRRRPPGAR